MKSIKAGPTNWVETLPLLLVVLKHGDPAGKSYARKELHRMAQVADEYLKEHPTKKTIKPSKRG